MDPNQKIDTPDAPVAPVVPIQPEEAAVDQGPEKEIPLSESRLRSLMYKLQSLKNQEMMFMGAQSQIVEETLVDARVDPKMFGMYELSEDKTKLVLREQ